MFEAQPRSCATSRCSSSPRSPRRTICITSPASSAGAPRCRRASRSRSCSSASRRCSRA